MHWARSAHHANNCFYKSRSCQIAMPTLGKRRPPRQQLLLKIKVVLNCCANLNLVLSACLMERSLIGLARTRHIYGVYTFFCREITNTNHVRCIYTVLAKPTHSAWICSNIARLLTSLYFIYAAAAIVSRHVHLRRKFGHNYGTDRTVRFKLRSAKITVRTVKSVPYRTPYSAQA